MTELVEKLKEKVQAQKGLNFLPIFLCRRDGVLLHAQNRENFSGDVQSVGVLMSSVWQAAESMASFLDGESPEDEFFRLTFDTSEKGVTILPLKYDGEVFFVGAFFQGVRNPGVIKNQLRNLVRSCEIEENVAKKTTEEDYLFKNITDDEINHLFSFVKD